MNLKFAAFACLFASTAAFAQNPSATAPAPVPAAQKFPGAYIGYTLIAPTGSPIVTLIDMDGKVVHTWQTAANPASSTYLLDSGNLLRPFAPAGGGGLGGGWGRGASTRPTGAAAGGRIQEIAWDGTVAWDFDYETPTQAPHHDAVKLPNGNALFLIWDAKTAEQAIAAGRDPQYQRGALPPDGIMEVKPDGKSAGKIVWEWCVWDHLVQDFDKSKPNYADVAAHPELIDINYSESWMDPPAGGGQGGRGAGGAAPGGGGRGGAPGRIATTDWTHLNAIAYNAQLDQIIVSSYTFSEFWIIDHSTTTAQAATHAGGKSGHGGDLLYRYGNPEAYRNGKGEDQVLFCAHNAQWIAPGLNGAGHVLIFNNGCNRPNNERFSEVMEFETPVDKDGKYARDGNKFAAPKVAWSYAAANKTDFYSQNIGGAQRLPNGNTLICSGANGKLFEVTADKKIVWEYTVTNAGGGRGGAAARGPGGGGTQTFRALRYAADFPGLKGKELIAPNWPGVATPGP